MTFGVDPDTHIDSLEQAEAATVEGTSKWSCKLTITGTKTYFHISNPIHIMYNSTKPKIMVPLTKPKYHNQTDSRNLFNSIYKYIIALTIYIYN